MALLQRFSHAIWQQTHLPGISSCTKPLACLQLTNLRYLSRSSASVQWITGSAASHAGSTAQRAAAGQSINDAELRKFNDLAGQWWDPHGPFGALQRMNPARCRFIKEAVCCNYGMNPLAYEPLRGLRLLDVGCGGGLLSENLARLGAQVYGIDAAADSVHAAARHAEADVSIAGRWAYSVTTAEQLLDAGEPFAAVVANEVIDTSTSHIMLQKRALALTNHCVGPSCEAGASKVIEHVNSSSHLQKCALNYQNLSAGESFDAVVASEVIEHVNQPQQFLETCARLTKPGGSIILSTINRTLESLLLAKGAAEYVLRLVPVGTHEWSKFITPEELVMMCKALEKQGIVISLQELAGMAYNPLSKTWTLETNAAVNYIAAFKRLEAA